MLKNMKKVFFALFLGLICTLVFACNNANTGKEANKDNCKEFCEECTECEKCNNANAETCKDYCQGSECPTCPVINKENCADYCETCPTPTPCDYVKPTSFIIFDDDVTVGTTSKNELDEVSPRNAYTGVIWSSSDESILTVDQDGVMTGVRPGFVDVTATSVLNPEATATVTIRVVDNRDPIDIVSQEAEALVAQMPVFASEDFEWPQPWNLSDEIEVKVLDGENKAQEKFTYPVGLTADKLLSFSVVVKVGAVEKSLTFKIWAVVNANDNTSIRLDDANSAAAVLLKAYAEGGEKVAADLLLPEYIYGVQMNWTTTNPYVLGSDGKYYRPAEDKNVTLSGTEKYLDGSKNFSFPLVVKGYDKEETVKYILEEGSLANIAGKSFSTSFVVPEFDDKFGAKLSFTSKDPKIFDNGGKLVASPAAATEVVFEVEIDNTASKENSFKEVVEITVTALPENAASKVAEAWLQGSEFKKVAHTPYGTEKGNVLDLPVAGEGYTVKWNVEGAKVTPNRWYAGKDENDQPITSLPAFALTEEGKVKIIAQPLRYKEVQIQGTFKVGDDEATVNLVLNIGISEFADIIRTGVWRSSDQGDGSLSPERGAYDLYDNASHFDDSVGYTKTHYGSGLWSGYVIRNTEPFTDGMIYETVFSDLMYFEVNVVDGAAVADVQNLTGGNGGNWGWLMYNNSDQDIKIEVGTYSDSSHNKYAPVEVTDENYQAFGLEKGDDGKFYEVVKETAEDGTETTKKVEVTEYAAPLTVALGSRLNLAIDGFALGFVTDANGKVLYGSGNDKFEQSIPDQRIKVGDDKLLIADSTKGTTINYVVVPAHGYAASWKYQFYGVGVAATLYPLCQVGSVLDIKRYDVHPLQEGFAQSALAALEAAEKAAANGEVASSSINNARAYYDKLSGATKEDVFDVARLEALEALLAKDFDERIAKLLKDDPAEGFSTDAKFVETLAKYYTEHKNNSKPVQDATTKAADLIACYEKYAALDLTITYDYDGGYAQGFYAYTDKAVVLPLFLEDLYSFLVEQKAWGDTPYDKAKFMDKTSEYWTKRASLTPETDELTKYLFTPAVDSEGNKHADYRDVIDGATTFFNDARYNKWIDIMDFVNEATEAGNRGGQDAWGRLDEVYLPYMYANKYKDLTDDLRIYSGKETIVTNKGTALGAYRFCQWVNDSIGAINYKGYIPHNVYSTIFDRQNTQERYGKQVYHCTDLTVKLYDAPYKKGYEFAGWFFVNEDGSFGKEAVVTGSMFKDLTVKAKWLPGLLAAIAKATGKDNLKANYYPTSTDGGKYMKAQDNSDATLADHEAQVGLGKYAFVIGDTVYLLPKAALIELGKGDDEGKTYTTKAELEPYGVDEAQNSTGIVYDADGNPVKQNSYGHGALYQNAGTKAITIAQIELAYGRSTVTGTAYGYHKYQFHYDAEKKAYVAKLLGASGSATLEPGDFLWCPMTAERFVTGLTDCDGSSGKAGVLSDGLEVQIIDVSEFTPAPSKEWHSVLFYSDDELVYQFYPEEGEAYAKPADLEKLGYNFLGWNTDKEATAGIELVLTPEANLVYYAIWEECKRFDEVIVTSDPKEANEYSTIAEALNHVNDNAVVKLTAGTYDEKVEINTPVTIQGPNADIRGWWQTGFYNGAAGTNTARKDEALFTGTITVKVDNVTLKGIHFGGDNSIYEADAYSTGTAARKIKVVNGTKGFAFVNNLVTAGRIFLDMANNTNTLIDGNFFNWTPETATKYGWWRPIRMDGVSENFKFSNNKVVQTVSGGGSDGFYDLLYFANAKGEIIIEGNDFTMNIYNWLFNVAKATEAIHFVVKNNVVNKVDGKEAGAGWAAENLHEDSTAEIIGNTFYGISGTTYSYKTIKHLTVKYNEFLMSVYKPRINANIGDGLDYADNYVAAEKVTALDGFLAVTKDSDKTQAEVVALRQLTCGVRDVLEGLPLFFADYAKWCGVEDPVQFQKDWLAKTGTYNADKELYALNSQGVIDDTLSRFANSSEWGVKYLPLIDALDAVVNDVNSAQHAWASPYTGLMRFRNYILKGTYRTDAHDQLLVDGLNLGIMNNAKYQAALDKKATGTKLGEITIECGGLSMWTADYYNNYVYLYKGPKSGTYWAGVYLNSVGNGLYEVVAYKESGSLPVSKCDFSLIVASANATDYAALTALGIKVGDIVEFSVDPATLDLSGALEAPLPVATVYHK